MFKSIRFIFIFTPLTLLLACGGGTQLPDQTTQETVPPRSLEFVAGYLGGEGNADGLGGRFSRPGGIAVNSAGVVFVMDGNGGPLRRINRNGYVSSILGTGDASWFKRRIGGEAKFSSLTFDASGNLYAADSKGCAIYRLGRDRRYDLFAGGDECGFVDGPREQAMFRHILDMVCDHLGNLYVVDNENFVVRKIDSAGNVSSYAGKAGVRGSLNGARSQALFTYPSAIAIKHDGTLFVADGIPKGSIRMISMDGIVSNLTLKPSSPKVPRTLLHLGGMVTDRADNLYVMSEAAIYKIASDGMMSVFVDGRSHGSRREGPSNSLRINSFGVGNETLELWTLGKLAIDKEDNLYFADWYDSIVRKIRPDGWVSIYAGKYPLDWEWPASGVGAQARFRSLRKSNSVDQIYFDHEQPYWLTLDEQENVIVSYRDWTVYEWDDYRVDHDGKMTIDEEWSSRYVPPTHVGSDGTKFFVLSDRINVERKKDAPSNPEMPYPKVTNLAGATSFVSDPYHDPVDGIGDKAVFFNITSSTIDQNGNVYVIDRDRLRVPIWPEPWGNGRLDGDREEGGLIRKITPDGKVTTIAGSLDERGSVDGPGNVARFHVPSSIVADKRGNLFITDTYNHVIRKIDAKGMVSTFAGAPEKPGWQDGVGKQAGFKKPDRIIMDHEGNLIVADSGNCLLRKITPAGTVSTLMGRPGKCGVMPGQFPAGLSAISGMVLDSKNVLYLFSELALLKVQL